MTHCMVDLETLSTRTFPILVSLGAVLFDPTADAVVVDSGSYFYQLIDFESCLGLGANLEQRTLEWWLQPEQAAAREHAFPTGASRTRVGPVLADWATWCREAHVQRVWSHGLTFDASILLRYFERLGIGDEYPVGFREHQDTRTLFDLVPEEVLVLADGTCPWPKHHPVRDAHDQARRVQSALRWVRP